MSLTEQREQQLVALIGRVEELEKSSEDLSPYALLNYVNRMLPIPKDAMIKSGNNNLSLKHTDPSLVVLDCGGGEITVQVPGANKSNQWFVILNNSS